MDTPALQVEWVATERLTPNPANPRHNDDAVPHVAASIKRFGWQQPVVAKRSGEVIAGHTRLKAAESLKLKTVPVVWFDGPDIEATAFGIADNRTHEFATWDEPELKKLLAELQAEDALEGVGYTSEELDEILKELSKDSAEDEAGEVNDPGPEKPPKKPVTRKGDLWILGAHRILCGDSTNPDNVSRVMTGDKADLVATDPPYLVDYTGERPNDSGKDWTDTYKEVEIADAEAFFRSVFGNVLEVLAPNAAIYCWHAHKRQRLIAQIWDELGILDHQQIVWVKPTAVFGRVFWHFRHEPCMMGWRKGSKPEHDGNHEFNSVWECDWDGKARVVGNEHPCLHPESLVLTDSGYREVQTIREGDRVYSADGTFRTVSASSQHTYTSPDLIRIVAVGGNQHTLATDNHPFLIWRAQRKGKHIIGGDVSWQRADKLKVGDYTMTPILRETEEDPLPDHSEEFWFLFGLYLAEGSFQHAGHGENIYPVFCINKARPDLVDRVYEHWHDQVSEYDRKSGAMTVMAFDPDAGSEFLRLGGRHAHAKRLDPIIWSLPFDKRLAVFEGWLNGDGCHVRGHRQAKTVSPDLAAQMVILGESLGYKATLFRYDPPQKMGSVGGRLFKSQRTEYQLAFYNSPSSKKPRFIDHEGTTYALRYIKDVERVPYEGPVCNLSVEGNPTFQTAAGMSHNTEKPIELFARPMRKHTEKGAVCFEPFSGSGSQIIAAEKLRRRCRAIEITPAYVDVAIRRWEGATGREAVLQETHKTFAEIASERSDA